MMKCINKFLLRSPSLQTPKAFRRQNRLFSIQKLSILFLIQTSFLTIPKMQFSCRFWFGLVCFVSFRFVSLAITMTRGDESVENLRDNG